LLVLALYRNVTGGEGAVFVSKYLDLLAWPGGSDTPEEFAVPIGVGRHRPGILDLGCAARSSDGG